MINRFGLLGTTVGPTVLAAALLIAFAPSGRAANRPNILWLTSEDHGPHVGCYGDPYASTPQIDRLAAKGMIYTRAWSTGPVCAVARTALISGMYPTSLGAHHMRSMVTVPSGQVMYPQLLRQGGYYCTNNSKTDYNLKEPARVWDESSGKAHWNKRKPGQPFFAIFNSTKSHESQIRVRPHVQVHDPAKVRIPAYHPDTPETRKDWAQYYDGVSVVDADAGKRLDELAAAGLEGDTIVFYFADHGSGMPRNKRWPYNAGLQVPLVVYIPEKFKDLRPPDYRAGGKSDRLVSFVDFAPTLLSLAGLQPPTWMQGHAFLGRFQTPPQLYLFGQRGRMDERIDLVHSVTDGRFVYIRNYLPHKIYGQHLDYMFQTPTTRVWKSLHDAGKLTPAQDAFWNVKLAEELYDLTADRDEVDNLAAKPEYQAIVIKLGGVLCKHLSEIRDVGFLPEGEIHRRSRGSSPYEMGHDPGRYPFERIFHTAEAASLQKADAVPALKRAARDDDPAVRYWATLGLLMRGRDVVREAHAELSAALDDLSPFVQIGAAEALGRYGADDEVAKALRVLAGQADWSKNDVFVVLESLNAIDAIGERAAPLRDLIHRLPTEGPTPDPRYGSYVLRLVTDLKQRFP